MSSAARSNDKWTAAEDAVLKRMKAAGMDWNAISTALGRTVEAVRHRSSSLSDTKGCRREGAGSPWTPMEDAALRRLCAAGLSWPAIAREIGRSRGGCVGRAKLLGLRHSKPVREENAAIAPYKRRCHDCGKPTTDYRCPSCLAKWRAKNGVSPGGREDDEYAVGTGWFFTN